MFRTLLWIYSILYTFLLIFYLPLFVYRVLVQGKDPSILLRRIGAPPLRNSSDPARPSIWIHAVSVGEVKAIEPLVEALALNRDQLFISTITDTGQSLARSRFQDRALGILLSLRLEVDLPPLPAQAFPDLCPAGRDRNLARLYQCRRIIGYSGLAH